MESSAVANATSAHLERTVSIRREDAISKRVKRCGRCKGTRDVRKLDDVVLCEECRAMMLEAC